jgi:hypothetical protein
METLFKQFVKQKNLSLTDLAKDLGYSRVHLTNVANGFPAGKRLAKKIELWSGGQVPAVCLLYPLKRGKAA